MKKKIKDNVRAWDSYELDGNLPEIIAKLQAVITDNPNYFDFTIDVESESGYYGSCSTNITINALRWETDAEMNERIAVEKNKKERAELNVRLQQEANAKRERSLYESLKRKFENEVEASSNKKT
jgi:hypothetical protein